MIETWRKACRRKGLLWLFLLKPLSGLYWLAWKLAAWLRPRPVKVDGLRVVSVGNLSVGGTGKSSLARLLARESLRRKFKTAILLRGYGAQTGPRPLWVDAKTAVAACGDEAAEHRRAGLQVIVDADRLRGARLARERGVQVLILDDGFQRRWQLARQADLILASWHEIAQGEHLLPAGPWREPWHVAARATQLLVLDAPKNPRLPWAWAALPALFVGYKPQRLWAWTKGGLKAGPALAALKGKRVLALSGLGQPERFEASLKSLGAWAEPRRFQDHHVFTMDELRALTGIPVVTTMKDAMRLPVEWEPGTPVWVLEAELDGTGLKAVLKKVLA